MVKSMTTLDRYIADLALAIGKVRGGGCSNEQAFDISMATTMLHVEVPVVARRGDYQQWNPRRGRLLEKLFDLALAYLPQGKRREDVERRYTDLRGLIDSVVSL